MTPKVELLVGLVIVFVLVPVLVWALIADIRSGETTFYRRWNFMRIFKRHEDEGAFWQQIINGAVADLIVMGLGVWFVYHGLHNL